MAMVWFWVEYLRVGSSGFRFGDDFSPTVLGFGAPKPTGSISGLVFHPCIPNGYLFEIKTHVLYYTNNNFIYLDY
jgi:hypothetical protein